MKLPFGYTMRDAIVGAFRLIVLLGMAGLFYLRSTFTTQDEIKAVVSGISEQIKPLTSGVTVLESRVKNLEDWQKDQKQAQLRDDQRFSVIQQDVAAIKTVNTEMAKNVDRIFNRLDIIADKK